MTEDALHNDFVLDFLEELFSETRVEDLLNCDRRAVEKAAVDGGETALTNLLAYKQLRQLDFANSGDVGESARLGVDSLRRGKALELLLLQLLLE
jgi:hypothetical protein